MGLVDYEFLVESIAMGSHVVCFSDILNRDGLRTMLRTYPVGIREIDADGCARESVSRKHGGVDDLGGNSLYSRLTESWVDGGVVFKPLGIVGDSLRAGCRFVVLEIDVRFPRARHAERVAIALDKTIDEIHVGGGVFCPKNGIFIEKTQVAGDVVVDQLGDVGFWASFSATLLAISSQYMILAIAES